MKLPTIIQGGMGIGISTWRLAKAVSEQDQLGVVSGTGLSRVMACRLLDGDLAGNVRRALDKFPIREPIQNILKNFYIPDGKPPDMPYKSTPMYSLRPSKFVDQLTAIANYAEVILAREGHSGVVGINLLEKVQFPTLASLYGAILAGVDYVLMGAGIPTQVAGILDKLTKHEAVSYRVDAQGTLNGDSFRITFDPERIFPGISNLVKNLKRPSFLPIVSSTVLAQALIKRSEGEIDGFIIEGHTAGGHNAPPRGTVKLDEKGEPIYGDKDAVDLKKMKEIGRPFWLAGGYGHPAQVQKALESGAAGVQVGSVFALCEESGMEPGLKTRIIRQLLEKGVSVRTDSNVSPTGFPFKVAEISDTLSDKTVYENRKRICDLGFLRTLFKREDEAVIFRCPAEPIDNYVRKGGKEEDTKDRVCLCNSLMATAGIPQMRPEDYREPSLVTSGDDLSSLFYLLKSGQLNYTAADVINYLLGPILASEPLAA